MCYDRYQAEQPRWLPDAQETRKIGCENDPNQYTYARRTERATINARQRIAVHHMSTQLWPEQSSTAKSVNRMTPLGKMSSVWLTSVSVFLLLLLQQPPVDGELFTALADMEELLETEAVLITNLDNYVQAQEEKLMQLRQ
uniref:Prolyl 4-hydroxylase N-terminal domain-containing protein n=1 Tax=Anopheles coluzzii TaxID=1518534 RepID=A0A8W7PY05_ANOCL